MRTHDESRFCRALRYLHSHYDCDIDLNCLAAEIDGGDYAVLHYHGTYADLDSAGDWLLHQHIRRCARRTTFRRSQGQPDDR